jgi:hypothetical protein
VTVCGQLFTWRGYQYPFFLYHECAHESDLVVALGHNGAERAGSSEKSSNEERAGKHDENAEVDVEKKKRSTIVGEEEEGKCVG